MINLSPTDAAALEYVATQLKIPRDWLAAVINFETAGTWDPKISNPNSSARGLIQFMDTTARDLGYASSIDLVTKHPTIESQLKGPVLKYFLKFRPPFRTKQDLYFSVFLPKYRRAPMDTVIYSEDKKKQAAFQKANPGIKTVGDYYRKLEKAFGNKAKFNPGPIIAALFVGVIAYKFFFSPSMRNRANGNRHTEKTRTAAGEEG